MTRRRYRWLRPFLLSLPIIVIALTAGLLVSATQKSGTAARLNWTDDLSVPAGVAGDATPASVRPNAPRPARRQGDQLTFGPSSGAKSLLLYDGDKSKRDKSELNALAAGLLASHFGPVTAQPVNAYRAGAMTGYDAVLYVGAREHQLPSAFLRDVTSRSTPVIWAGGNVGQLAAAMGAPAKFQQKYGWDAAASRWDTAAKVVGVSYRDRVLSRDAEHPAGGLLVPKITSSRQVTVLARAVCGTERKTATCAGTSAATLPWAVRSANLTYIGEVPFTYVGDNDRYLAYADLLYDSLGRDIPAIQQAAVRLEDVSPVTDPDRIRTFADYFAARNIPFQIAVIPRYLDPQGVFNEGRPTSVTLGGARRLVDALKYAQERGATLIQHGTTHQFESLENPYNAVTGDDYEFFRAGCSSNDSPPYKLIRCTRQSPVRYLGALPAETTESAAARISHGRDLFVEAGLDAPTVFETPHYAASANAYRAMRQFYDTRYERIEYPDGLLSGREGSDQTLSIHFPYAVTDVFGSRILPENLDHYSVEAFSGHAPRGVKAILRHASANLVVRESTASFFFHPFLPVEKLDEIVTGIQGLGYTFVPATELH